MTYTFGAHCKYIQLKNLINELEVASVRVDVIRVVSYPGKGECADPVNEDAILEEEGGGETPGRDKERQLASDTGGGKT